MWKRLAVTQCTAVLLLHVMPASAGLFDGKGVDIGPIHIDPTNPVAPVSPKSAPAPNPAAPLAPAKVTDTVQKALQDTAKTAQDAAKQASDLAQRAAGEAGKGAMAPLVASTKAANDAADVAAKAAHDAEETAKKAGKDINDTAVKAARDAAATADKAAKDANATLAKAIDDSGRAIDKGAKDVIDAGVVVGKFLENQAKGHVKALSDAERRLREGKVVDAVWHSAMDPLKDTDKNAAQAAQESVILRTVAQVAATAYGGPAGAAAFAAWYTFHQTGDAGLALKMGLIAGATAYGFDAAGTLPTDTAAQVAQKAIVTGAIGGAAVAAAGGGQEAVRDGFLLSGGMVLVQYGYQETTDHPLDSEALKSSKGDAYCMATLDAPCSPPDVAVEHGPDGQPVYETEDGIKVPKVDVTKTDPARPHVGKWSTADGDPPFVGERSAGMTAVSRVPGMNAMSVFHDQWAVSWHFDQLPAGSAVTVATIPPAVVLTYVGAGSPYYEKLQEAGTEKAQKQN
ncbi:hypothetical protein [Rhizobium grahamii]|uniref:Uncharacterized protein n=1 Tax=Rhizobium grahamii CCGE 502 TaxID=990285 RepID=S3I228_9HYPH|nr:hypothetical protein [Rhizobium grahamii]EPE93848.1 hypothetical protein RGCCGE502_33701 [Rhizobium grahamii CCGE 502]